MEEYDIRFPDNVETLEKFPLKSIIRNVTHYPASHHNYVSFWDHTNREDFIH